MDKSCKESVVTIRQASMLSSQMRRGDAKTVHPIILKAPFPCVDAPDVSLRTHTDDPLGRRRCAEAHPAARPLRSTAQGLAVGGPSALVAQAVHHRSRSIAAPAANRPTVNSL